MTDQATTTVRRFFASQDERRGGPEPELVTEGYIAQLSAYPSMDLAAHHQFSSMFYAAFPDLKHGIEEVVGLGDRVAVRFRITGTNTESFMGMPASGKPIEINAIALMTVLDGKVAKVFGAFDELSMMQQIGAIPAQVG